MSYVAPNLAKTKHCFWGRTGGVSTGKYQSLNVNLKSKDEKANLVQNLEIVAQRYGLSRDNMILCRQGVTNHAEFVSEPSLVKITADGLVTKTPNLILGIRTADCAPVLFCDEQNQVIGAAHAGWRGALRGIVENTVDLMLIYGAKAENIKAAIGPCLQQSSFECMDDMRQEFLSVSKAYDKYFTLGKDDDHYQFNLEAFVWQKCANCGIRDISASHIDTYKNEQEYFSYRRYSKQEKITEYGDYPTQLSTIVL